MDKRVLRMDKGMDRRVLRVEERVLRVGKRLLRVEKRVLRVGTMRDQASFASTTSDKMGSAIIITLTNVLFSLGV